MAADSFVKWGIHNLKNYVEGWAEVVRELERIARLRPEQCYNNAEGAEQALLQLEWDKVFDFCGSAQEFVEVANWRGFECSAW